MGVITPLIHLELRHYDRLHGDPEGLINFAKQRRLLEIVEGFLCHQRVPYTFNVDRAIQRALANSLEEFNEVNEAEFEAKMYGLSEAYEPRETPAEQPPTSVEVRGLFLGLCFLKLVHGSWADSPFHECVYSGIFLKCLAHWCDTGTP